MKMLPEECPICKCREYHDTGELRLRTLRSFSCGLEYGTAFGRWYLYHDAPDLQAKTAANHLALVFEQLGEKLDF